MDDGLPATAAPYRLFRPDMPAGASVTGPWEESSACTTPVPGELRPVEPNAANVIGIYACGPTVYGRIHVGNARPYVVFSLLARLLTHEGYEVTFVTNITDVNDKIYAAALTAGVGSEELAREMIQAYIADTDRLGLGRPDHEPRASETITEIIGLIERLVEGGHAYPADGDVYFAVTELPRNTGSCPTGTWTTWTRARVARAPSANATPPTSRSGRGRSRARTPRGSRRGAWDGRAGTSNARRWPRRCSASASRSTAAARI